MYRNSEGYADPTVGGAIAHMNYEARKERRARREAETRRQQEMIKKQKAKKKKRKQNHKKHEMTVEKPQRWTLAWPKPKETVIVCMEGDATT